MNTQEFDEFQRLAQDDDYEQEFNEYMRIVENGPEKSILFNDELPEEEDDPDEEDLFVEPDRHEGDQT